MFELFTFIKVKIINTSNNTISYDIINMILFYILIISATLLDNNNNNFNKNVDNFYDNISFCLINLIWLTYMLIRIVIFFSLEIFYFSVDTAKNIGFEMIFGTLLRSFFGVGVLGSGILNSILVSGLTIISGKGYQIYTTDEKIKKIFYNILNDFENKQIDFLYKYLFIFIANIIILIIIIVINVILKLKNNFRVFTLNNKEVNEEKNRLIRKAMANKYK